MMVYPYLIAVALLTNPDPLTGVEDAAALHQALAPTLQQVAIHWQILDPRETKHILCDARHFEEDLILLQKRCQDLANAPPVSECERFPDRELVSTVLSTNRSFRQELTERQQLDPLHSEEIRSALQEADHLYRIWDAVRDARCKYYYVPVRRQALQELRELIGDAAFYSGQLPPPLPVWRIPRIH